MYYFDASLGMTKNNFLIDILHFFWNDQGVANNSVEQIPANIYPKLSVAQIQDPNRFYAVPLVGFLIKCVMLIPVAIELIFLLFVQYFANVINSFVVLFTGKYWDTAYMLNLGTMRLTTKTSLFFFGLTNKYPGFEFAITDPLMSLDIPKPEHPNRFFAIPVFGGIARFILLIPYVIYASVIGNAAWLGAVIISFYVLFVGKYPESVYEITRDSVRLSLSSRAYIDGLSDSYPSFWISMNHQTVKLLLIIFAVLLNIGRIGSSFSNKSNYNYYNSMPKNMPVQKSLPVQQNPY